jgi:hypothetical protein
MKKAVSNSAWNLITTAPVDAELELCVYEDGEYHPLAFPCRRNGVGWSDVREGCEMVQCTWVDKKPREHRAAFVIDSLEAGEEATLRTRQGEHA